MSLIWVTNRALVKFSLGLFCQILFSLASKTLDTFSKEKPPKQLAVTQLISHQGHRASNIYMIFQPMNNSEVLQDCCRVGSSSSALFVPEVYHTHHQVFVKTLTKHRHLSDLSDCTTKCWYFGCFTVWKILFSSLYCMTCATNSAQWVLSSKQRWRRVGGPAGCCSVWAWAWT